MNELDPDVLRSCRMGDREAFRRMVDTYRDRVFALCVALAGSEGADIAQETFLRAYRAIKRFDPAGPARLSTWLLVIARRLCRDFARRPRMEELTPERLEAALPTIGAPDPEHHLFLVTTGARLRRALAGLPTEQRAVLVLRVWDGLEYEDIAAIEEVPVGTVRSRLSRARAILAAAVAEPEQQGGHRAAEG